MFSRHTQIDRRTLLGMGGVTALGLGLNLFSPAIFKRKLLAGGGGVTGPKKLIFIFQRGGNDGVNTVIPRGDSTYSQPSRPNLFIPEANAIDSGNGFAQFHPALQPMMEIYDSLPLTGAAGPGNLAVLHRVGYGGQSQSHFDSQHFWETGVPGDPTLEEGMIYRQVAETLDPTSNPFVAAAMENSQMLALRGEVPLPNFFRADQFTFGGSSGQLEKFLGSLPSAPIGDDGTGMRGLYGGPRDFPGKIYRELVYPTGVNLAEAVGIVQDALAIGPYTPENGAEYPGGTFGDKCEQVAMLFKRTDARILGINLGGWDTHNNQGGQFGAHSNLLGQLAQGYQALYRDLEDQWDDVLIVTMSEFGRTSLQNASGGTDHGFGGVMFVAGGGVDGGVYNCDAATWADGDMLSQGDRYVEHMTDYRAVFAEIFQEHFGDDLATLNQVIPGYDAIAAGAPDFVPLNFLV